MNRAVPATRRTELPHTAELLVQGGDARIALDAVRGVNRYGCAPYPAEGLLAFSSSTASVISGHGYAAADALRNIVSVALAAEPAAAIYARELARQRRELLELCGLNEREVECVFAASGTDVHRIAAQLVAGTRVVTAGVAESGSGVPAALAAMSEVVDVPVRQADGMLRDAADVDVEVAAAVFGAAGRVLLVQSDVSKSGLISPGPACVASLQQQLGDGLEVLVDACQFRLTPTTLRGYLEQGCMVALTGSKFVGGPSFSGALLLPAAVARRLRWRTLPAATLDYMCSAEWPGNWAAAEGLNDAANIGLLLRWEAALAELRRFRTLPEQRVKETFSALAAAIAQRLSEDPRFEALPVAKLDRLHPSWDAVQTIFPFLLLRGGHLLGMGETRRIYEILHAQGCHLGQPVSCGERNGVPIAALRLSLGARHALQAEEQGVERVIQDALAALDQVAAIIV